MGLSHCSQEFDAQEFCTLTFDFVLNQTLELDFVLDGKFDFSSKHQNFPTTSDCECSFKRLTFVN